MIKNIKATWKNWGWPKRILAIFITYIAIGAIVGVVGSITQTMTSGHTEKSPVEEEPQTTTQVNVDELDDMDDKKARSQSGEQTEESQKTPEVINTTPGTPQPAQHPAPDNAPQNSIQHQPATSGSSSSGYSTGTTDVVEGFCKDGTAVRGIPSARGRGNVCWGHGGWKDEY